MSTHIDNANVCENGCGALMNITFNNGKLGTINKIPHLFLLEYPADNQIKAGEAGAIEAIVNAMNEHIKNGAVCENGCGALMSITINGK